MKKSWTNRRFYDILLSMIDYSKFEKSLRHLDEQFLNYRNDDKMATLFELDREAIAHEY